MRKDGTRFPINTRKRSVLRARTLGLNVNWKRGRKRPVCIKKTQCYKQSLYNLFVNSHNNKKEKNNILCIYFQDKIFHIITTNFLVFNKIISKQILPFIPFALNNDCCTVISP